MALVSIRSCSKGALKGVIGGAQLVLLACVKIGEFGVTRRIRLRRSETSAHLWSPSLQACGPVYAVQSQTGAGLGLILGLLIGRNATLSIW